MRYLISGASAVAIDLVLLFVLVHFFHMWYLLAAVIAFIAAVAVSFVMQKFFTFNDYTKGGIGRQTVFYLGLQVFNIFFNTLLMYVGVDLLGIPYLMSQILISVAMAIYNFLIYKHLVFASGATYHKDALISPCPSCGQIDNIVWGSKNNHTLVRCNSCGLIFVSPMPEETATFYNEVYFAGGGECCGYINYDRDKEPMRRSFESYLDHMESALGRKGRLLDVGCATGYFIDIARSRGWEVEGIDISEHAIEKGRAKGLTVQAGTLDNINFPEKSFDAITLLDVVEHLRDPKSSIIEARRLLTEGGIVVVATPDAGSLVARTLKSNWHLVVPPEHLVFFNRENLGNLLIQTGFSPVLVTNIGKHFTIPYIFRMLFSWQKLSLWNVLARWTNKKPISELKIPINFRDTFFVIARND